MPTKLVTVAEMLEIEKDANASGLSYEMMMENAGRNLAEVVEEVYGYLAEDGICGLVGSGNNGGDTLVALAYLAEQGWPASAVLIRPRQLDDPLVKRLSSKGGIIYQGFSDPECKDLKAQILANAVLLDGVLGTGIRLPLKPEVAQPLKFAREIIQEMSVPPMIVAVDCPSGVDCDSGEAAPEAIQADITVTMAAVKQGLFRFPANCLVGELKVVGIGLPVHEGELPAWGKVQTIVPDAEWVMGKMPARPRDAHKGTFGAALIIAGSVNYTGAAWLAGQAAYRIGAGLVTMAAPERLHPALAGQFPEATWLLLPEIDGFIDRDGHEIILENLERITAVLAGPGFGLHDGTREFLERLLTKRSRQSMGFFVKAGQDHQNNKTPLPPMVIDADGLKLLARIQDWPGKLPSLSILTPHPGEMSVLTGLSKDEIQTNRLEVARQYSQQWGHVVILKGAFTTIASPDGQAAVIPVATPALARAGTGDVLAGLVVGLRAQGVEPFSAAVAGAWIHAQAGWRAAERLGNSASVLAGDVLNSVIQVISEELV
jgi:ADP-dependent NAD(P)H-hydrate dehydratase / NAD(P)H-hydrate epimerase